MNLLLVFPFNENNNKPKSAQAIINCICGCCCVFFLCLVNQNCRENSFLFQQENVKKTKNGKPSPVRKELISY